MQEIDQPIAREIAPRQRPDYLGCVIGLAAFFGGVALLLVTFKLAFDMFSIPPEKALGMPVGGAVDFNRAGYAFAGLVFRALLLLVMSFIGSMIANRGIKLYLAGRQQLMEKGPKELE